MEYSKSFIIFWRNRIDEGIANEWVSSTFQLYPRFSRQYLDEQVFTHSRFVNSISVACLSDLARFLKLPRIYCPATWTRRNEDGEKIPDSALTDDELILLAPRPLLSHIVSPAPEKQYDQLIPTPEVVAYQHPSVNETMKSIGILNCRAVPRETGITCKFTTRIQKMIFLYISCKSGKSYL